MLKNVTNSRKLPGDSQAGSAGQGFHPPGTEFWDGIAALSMHRVLPWIRDKLQSVQMSSADQAGKKDVLTGP